jgi:hypothetical protein
MADLSIVKSEPLPTGGLSIVKSEPLAPPPEPSPLAKAGKAFAEGLGLPALLDILRASNRYGTPQEVAARGERGIAAAQGIVQGIAGEPARVWDELSRTGESMFKGDLAGTAYHLAGAVPILGAQAQQVGQDIARGDPAAAVGHTAAMVVPFAHEPIKAGLTRTAEAGGALAEGALKTAKSATGAAVDVVGSVDPALREAVGVISPRAKHVLDVAARVKKARDAYAAAKAEAVPAPTPAAETPGQAFAKAQGIDYAALSPNDRALLEHLPEAPPPPPDPSFVRAVPAQYPDIIPQTLRANPAASDIAAQLEASMRTETLTDYLVRNKVPGTMLDEFGPKEWQMVADQAGVKPPSPENIQAIRENLTQHEGAAQITAKTPAEAVAEFEQNRSVRTRRKAAQPAEAAPADVGGQLAESLAAVEAGQRPVAEAPPETPRAATASEKRVEAYAQHFASDPSIAPADIAPLTKLPEFPKLGAALEIKGSLAPGEAERIAARVQELRGATAPPPAPVIIEPDVQSTPTVGQTTGEQPGSAGQAVHGPREPTNPVARGSATSVRVPGERTAYEGQYSVRELDDVHASHNAHTFEKNPNYQPRNDRDYSNPVNKERVVVNSKGDTFDPAYVLADSPDATNGAPVIDADGNVLGGNSRAMILERVYKNNPAGADAYKAELARKAPQLGIDPQQIAGMKRPVLVRELSDAGLNKQRAITDLNKTGTASLTAAERATADARMITPAASDYLATAIDAGGTEATLNDVLSGKDGIAIVNRLVDDGVFTMQERPNLVDPKTGAVTAAAKERISKLLLGQVFEDADQMTRTPAEVRNKLERTVSPILQSGQKAGFDIRPTVRQALDALEYARAHGITRISDLLAQGSMFADAPKFTQQAVDLAQFIRDAKPTAIAKAFRRYVANAEPTMYGESTQAEAFADAFGTELPPATLGELMQPEPPAAAPPRKRRSKPTR